MAEEVCEMVNLDRIVFVPSGNPPLKSKDILDAKDRYNLVKKAIAKNRHFQISPLEINQGGISYTFNTVKKMMQQHEDKELLLMLGIDAFCDLHLWHQPDRLIEAIDFIILTRYGFSHKELLKSPYLSKKSLSILKKMKELKDNIITFELKSKRKIYLLNTTSLNISSTMIRANIKSGKSIRYLVPDLIHEDIYKKYNPFLK